MRRRFEIGKKSALLSAENCVFYAIFCAFWKDATVVAGAQIPAAIHNRLSALPTLGGKSCRCCTQTCNRAKKRRNFFVASFKFMDFTGGTA